MQNFQNMFNLDQFNYNEVMQKNIDAMTKANQITMENCQAISRRVAEIMQRNVGDMVEATKDIMSSQNPEQIMHKQQHFVKSMTNDSIAHSKEVVEMASKSVMEVYDIFSKRASDNVNHSVKKAAK